MEEDGGGEPQETTFSGTPNAAPAEAPAGAFDQPAVMMGPKSSLPKVMGILMMLWGAILGIFALLGLLVVGSTATDYENAGIEVNTPFMYVDALVVRVNNHKNIVEMARNSSIPIINGLSNISHPCQVMADLMTIKEEKNSLDHLDLVWMGPITNVAHSWIEAYNKKFPNALY